MASFNRVILVGRLTRDVELRRTSTNLAVCEVGLAVNDRRKTANGEWVDETTFVEITIFGRTAEVAHEYLGKGSPVLIEGRLKLDRWEKDGQKYSKLRVICERMQMLSSGGERGGSRGSASNIQPAVAGNVGGGASTVAEHSPPTGYDTPGTPQAHPTGGGDSYNDENIPF
ncbi:MAG: single-stranded DNA-binding protein [Planctomycetota bacterium]